VQICLVVSAVSLCVGSQVVGGRRSRKCRLQKRRRPSVCSRCSLSLGTCSVCLLWMIEALDMQVKSPTLSSRLVSHCSFHIQQNLGLN